MALSNSFNYLVDAATILKDALENIGVVGHGETVDADDQVVALRVLNFIAKQWSSPSDSMPGLKVWLRREVYLFAQKGQARYDIGPGVTDKASLTLNRTTISADEAAGQTTLSVTTSTGMTASDQIGITLNDGSVQWTTVSSTGAGTVTVGAALTDAAASGNEVFWYTSAVGFKPLSLISATSRRWQNDAWSDSPMFYNRLIEDYEMLTNKDRESYPTGLWFEPQRLVTRVSFDSAFAASAPKVVRLLVTSPADDLDSATDDLMFPVEFHPALSWEVSLRCAPKFGAPWNETHQAAYLKAVSPAVNLNMPGSIGGFMVNDNYGPDDSDYWNT